MGGIKDEGNGELIDEGMGRNTTRVEEDGKRKKKRRRKEEKGQ